MARALLEYANRQKIADALTERGYSVTRMTVNRWARGSEMPPIAARMIEELFGHTQSETPRPRWAEGLATREDLETLVRAIIPAVVDEVVRNAGLDERLPDGQAPGSEDQPR